MLIFLIESIRTQLNNSKEQRKYYNNFLQDNEEEGVSLDQKFLNDFKSVMKKEMTNSEITADEIAKELGVSRVQLFRKVKALVGTGVNEYLLSLRLQKARDMLRNSDLTVAQVAYEVGFGSATYFATVFKQKFNITPTEFKNN